MLQIFGNFFEPVINISPAVLLFLVLLERKHLKNLLWSNIPDKFKSKKMEK